MYNTSDINDCLSVGTMPTFQMGLDEKWHQNIHMQKNNCFFDNKKTNKTASIPGSIHQLQLLCSLKSYGNIRVWLEWTFFAEQ